MLRSGLLIPRLCGLWGIVMLIAGLTAASAQPYQPPAASRPLVRNLGLDRATPVSEEYRAQFAICDRTNVFRGQTQARYRRCTTDPSRVKALLRLPSGAILFEAKMALDLDGSYKAWNSPGRVDLRHTWLQWCSQDRRSCQVDPDVYPFVVIPIAGPSPHGREFTRRTGVDKGDFGVVIFRDRWVPAFVADGGPYNKLGEASSATFAAVGENRCLRVSGGHCIRYREAGVSSGVLYILFPGSRRADMKPENAQTLARSEACRRLRLPGCS
jgi:hypothetical protein